MATIYSNNETVNINPTDDLVLYKEEFINSRIEKFLYAICALDFDDLPTPLSRIEELYKCLASGLPAPTFIPQSRVEKYLMAILGAYDASALPAPQSRTEVLLNKILLGDTDLSDIEWLKSRYEFLLAYIIKAGGFNGGSPDDQIYYVNYPINSSVATLYNTVEYPVKSAILLGQTLVNLAVDGLTEKILSPNRYADFVSNLYKQSTTYTIVLNVVTLSDTGTIAFHEYDKGTSLTTNIAKINVGINKILFTSSNNVFNQIRLRNPSAATTNLTIKNVMILEGDHTNADIPYFEGMTSVKMPVLKTVGKNLFDVNKFIGVGIDEQGYYIPKKFVDNGDYVTLKLKPNTNYTVTGTYIYNGTSSLVYRVENNGSYRNLNISFNTDATGITKIKIGSNNYDVSNPSKVEKIMIVESTLKDIYEPHKSTTVSCNEEVILRGIGDIKDELNLVTGELTQRIQERVFDGSENWIIGGTGTNYIMFRCESYTDMVKSSNAITCDRCAYNKVNNATSNLSVTNSTTTGKICIVTSQTDLSIDNFKAILNTDKPTIQYQLAEPIVKTVDLSIVDQDDVLLILENGDYIITENGNYIEVGIKGEKTKLKTFDDLTHVIVSSEELVPTGEIDIARPIQFVDYSLDNGVTTLYNTIEYPVKNAVLRGQTLVNLPNKLTTELSNSERRNDYKLDSPLTAGKKYLICFNGTVENGGDLKVGALVNNSTWGSETVTWVNGHNKVIIIISTNSDYIRISSSLTKVTTSEVMVIEYQDGMENWDIPYFEGMASVKMPVLTTTGKNLFDVSRHGSLTPQPTGDIQLNSAEWGKYDVKYILKPNTQYTLTILGDGTKCWIAIFVDGSSNSSNVETSYTKTFSTNSNGEVTIGIYANSDKYVGYSRKSISIEEGTVSTPYEPYKSNILTVNEDVVLCGIGDVKDELDLVTGEVTQRIGEVVFDGSEDWVLSAHGNSTMFYTSFNNLVRKEDYLNSISCDKLVVHTNESYLFNSTSPNGISAYADWAGAYPNENWIYIKYADSEGYVEKLKQWLSQNPITVQYELTTESVKTVDLSTLDQDGKKTKLSTFNDITHVTVSSEELVSTGEITVATKNTTDVIDISVMSLRMDDISNSQRTLEESANAQSDDIDATMLGATDIYEQLL